MPRKLLNVFLTSAKSWCTRLTRLTSLTTASHAKFLVLAVTLLSNFANSIVFLCCTAAIMACNSSSLKLGRRFFDCTCAMSRQWLSSMDHLIMFTFQPGSWLVEFTTIHISLRKHKGEKMLLRVWGKTPQLGFLKIRIRIKDVEKIFPEVKDAFEYPALRIVWNFFGENQVNLDYFS